MKSNEELEAELVECRNAIRDLYALQCRFKPGSFERNPMPALQRILDGEEQYDQFAGLPTTGLEQVGTGGPVSKD